MRALLDECAEIVLRPFFRALGYDVLVCADGSLTLAELKGGGAKLYGRSRGGRIVLSPYDDLLAQINAAEKLLNRVYGRPKVQADSAGETDDRVPSARRINLAELTNDELATLEAIRSRIDRQAAR